MFTIKCAKCKKKIFKYEKVGKGRLWHCWKERIKENYSVQDSQQVKCRCGALIGIDKGRNIAMKQQAFTSSGQYE
jgi:hypothetical protein